MYLQIGGSTKKWKTLEHNGLLFPPEYKKLDIPIIYKEEKILLSEDAEECAYLYAKYIDTPYNNDKMFRKNFYPHWLSMV